MNPESKQNGEAQPQHRTASSPSVFIYYAFLTEERTVEYSKSIGSE